MTLSTLVTLNAVLAAILVYGIVWLLAGGIRADRAARGRTAARLRTVAEPERYRRAA
jgi:hypothetical protein